MSAPRLVVLTNSELGAFRTCRRKWYLSYHLKLSPKKRAKALDVGSAAHAGFAEMYAGIKQAQDAGSSRIEVAAVADRALGAAKRYLETWRKGFDSLTYFDLSPQERADVLRESESATEEALTAVTMFVATFAERDFDEYRVLEVERSFEVPLGDRRTRSRQRGKRDVVLEHKQTGTIVLDEHKTTVSDASLFDARLDVDPQIRSYLNSLRIDYPGRDIGTMRLNVVRKSAPKHPNINKDGKVSVAACDTTRAIYETALKEQVYGRGIAVTQAQIEFAESLPISNDRWVSRHEHHFDAAELDAWLRDTLVDVRLKRMIESGRLGDIEEAATRNGASCTLPWLPPCVFRSVCNGHPLASSDFVTRDEKYPELDGPEAG